MINVIFLGLVSFFADLSSEMVYPLIPIYLTSVLGATPTLVGVIEGIAESLASLLKVFSGYISDKYNKKKPIAFFGYATGLVYKIALIFAGSWYGILFARIIDRLGKGIRTAPRDVMVSESADENATGKTFGIHKALDMAGSAIGILLAFVLFKSIGSDSYKTIFIVSIIPMVLALSMFGFIKENKEYKAAAKREPFWKNVRKLDGRLKLYLLVAFVFTLGNSSNTFLLLKASNIGFSNTNTILLYFIYNLVASVFAIPFGKKSDSIGRKKILVLGYIVFAFVYFNFAFATNKVMIVLAFIIYGLYTAMVVGVEKAFISEIAPKDLKGTMLGLHSTLVGIALFPASVIAGLLWDYVGGFAPFVLGATLSLISALILQIGLKNSNELPGNNK
jgi:MFS family permease